MRPVQRLVFALLLLTVPAAVLSQDVSSSRVVRTRSVRTARRRRGQWDVDFAFDQLDSLLLDGVDTASTEGAWCLEAERDEDSRTLTVMSLLLPEVHYNTRDSVSFTCPKGSVIAHRHFLDLGHVDGPSSHDRLVARQLRTMGVVIVVDRGRETARYVAY